MFTHIFRRSTKTDTREVVDCETCILGIVHGEHTTAAPSDFVVLKALRNRLQAHGLRHFVEHDLDEDTATRSCIVLSQFDAFEHSPRDRIRAEQVAEEASDVAKAVGLVSVDSGVVVVEGALETFVPDPV